GRDIRNIIQHVPNVEPLAFGFAPSTKIDGIDGEPGPNQLFGRPLIIAGMRVETRDDDDYSAGCPGFRPPGAGDDRKITQAPERRFSHDVFHLTEGNIYLYTMSVTIRLISCRRHAKRSGLSFNKSF